MRIAYHDEDGTIRYAAEGINTTGDGWLFFGQDISGQAVYATAQWLEGHDSDEPYEITGDQGTYRLTVEKVA